MSQDLLFDRINTRVALDKEDGDHAYFHALSLKLEHLAKIVTAGVVACVGDDVDRQRYSLEHRLVRADSIGTWIETLNGALVGPPSQLFSGSALDLVRDLTQRVSLGDWRHTAVTNLNRAAREIGVETQLGNRWGRMAIVDTKPFKLRVILHRIFVERPQVTGIPAWPGGAACYRRSRYIL